MHRRRITLIALSTLVSSTAVPMLLPSAASAASGVSATKGSAASSGVAAEVQDGLIVASTNVGMHFVMADGTGGFDLNPPNGGMGPVWSPDGHWVAYQTTEGQGGVVVSRPDGTSSVRIPGSDAVAPFNSPLAWSPATGSVIWSGLGSGGAERLFTAPGDGSRAPQLLLPPSLQSADSDNDPSAAGHVVAFARMSSGAAAGVWVYDLSAGTLTEVVPGGLTPSVSPDGTKLAYVESLAGDAPGLYVSNIDGSDPKLLSSTEMGTPAWSPTGTRIITGASILDASTGAVVGANPVQAYFSKPSWQPVLTDTATYGTTGAVSGVRAGDTVVSAASGTATTTMAHNTSDVISTPNGSRLIYSSLAGADEVDLRSAGAAGGSDRLVSMAPTNARETHPALDPVGGYLLFNRTDFYNATPQIYVTTSDGTRNGHEWPMSGITPAAGESDDFPAVSPDGHVAYERDLNGVSDVMRVASGTSTVLLHNAAQPAFALDGSRIAFVRPDSSGVNQIFVVKADGVSGLTQVTHDAWGATRPNWSPDGKSLIYSEQNTRDAVEVTVADGTEFGRLADLLSPTWRPPTNQVEVLRAWGSDRGGTAIAASQTDFRNNGDTSDQARSQAGAVVLSRSDNYADALGGSSLAVAKNAPLLITPSGALDDGVAHEISRVLAPGGTVYLLGGTGALSADVENAVKNLHFTVVRLSGANRFATAVAIAKAVDPTPSTVMIASGTNFPDALAAGATGLPLVLTGGSSMPVETAAYLNSLNPTSGHTQLVSVGGPGDAALIAGYQSGMMPSWPSQISRVKLVGNAREDTALMVAEDFFAANTDVAIATSASWPDALSGGAMVGHRGGPLLLTGPGGLYGPVADYLSQQSGSIWTVEMLGGTGALPAPLVGQIQARIGYPGQVGYEQIEPGTGPSPALRPALPKGTVVTRDGGKTATGGGAPAQSVRK